MTANALSSIIYRNRGVFGSRSMSSTKDINETAGDYWDRQLEKMKTKTITRVRWWEDPTTKHHINAIVGNRDLTEVHAAFHERIANILSGKRQLKALSVGCGAGTKEMWLMQHIDVAEFDLFDISSANIAFGMEEALSHPLISPEQVSC